MYIFISVFRIGKTKVYRKIIFYTKKDVTEYIFDNINKNETVVLLKQDERKQERKNGMNENEYFAYVLARSNSPEELHNIILQDKELIDKIVNHAYGSEEPDATYCLLIDGYYYDVSEIKRYITDYIEHIQDTIDWNKDDRE